MIHCNKKDITTPLPILSIDVFLEDRAEKNFQNFPDAATFVPNLIIILRLGASQIICEINIWYYTIEIQTWVNDINS